MLPFSTTTRCSLTHAPVTLRSVCEAREMACWMASSKLVFDIALSSVTGPSDAVHVVRHLRARVARQAAQQADALFGARGQEPVADLQSAGSAWPVDPATLAVDGQDVHARLGLQCQLRKAAPLGR